MIENAPKKENLFIDPTIVKSILDKTKHLRSFESKNSNIISLDDIRIYLTTEEDVFVQEFLKLKPEDLGVHLRQWGKENDAISHLVRISGQKYTQPTTLKDEGVQINEEIVESNERQIRDQFLPPSVLNAFHKMNEAMSKPVEAGGCGNTVLVQSGYRSFAYQLLVFLGYLQSKNFDLKETAKLVALPGYSEHEDSIFPAIDFLDPTDRPFKETEQYKWLTKDNFKNAKKFGFNLSFPGNDASGIQSEPWHWKFNFTPNKSVKPFEGSNMKAEIYGKNPVLPSDLDWRMLGFNKTEDVRKPEFAHLVSFLKNYARENKIKTFYAPIATDQNGEIVEDNLDFPYEHEIDLGDGVTLKRDGPNKEGCEIKKGEAFLMTPADCLTVTVKTSDGRIFAAHAGRESIYKPGRASGVIENLIKATGQDPSKLEFFIGFGISAGEHFSHPEDDTQSGKFNKERHDNLRAMFPERVDTEIYKDAKHLDIKELAKNICIKSGVSEENIKTDNTDTSEIDAEGNKVYANYRRDRGNMRNMVVVSNPME